MMLTDLHLTIKQCSAWTQLTIRKQLKIMFYHTPISKDTTKIPSQTLPEHAETILVADLHPNMLPEFQLEDRMLMSHPDYPWPRQYAWDYRQLHHPKLTHQFAYDHQHNTYRHCNHSAMWVVHNTQHWSMLMYSKTTSQDDRFDYSEYYFSSWLDWTWTLQLKWRYEFFDILNSHARRHHFASKTMVSELDLSDSTDHQAQSDRQWQA